MSAEKVYFSHSSASLGYHLVTCSVIPDDAPGYVYQMTFTNEYIFCEGKAMAQEVALHEARKWKANQTPHVCLSPAQKEATSDQQAELIRQLLEHSKADAARMKALVAALLDEARQLRHDLDNVRVTMIRVMAGRK